MTLPARRPATYADLAALPENVVGEILDGDLIVNPRPAPRHAATSSALGVTLGAPFQFGDGGPGGWWIIDEPELHLGENVLVPDLAGWRRERMPMLPEGAFFAHPPDWVCEVLSPSTSRTDRTKKLPLYARAAIPHLWLIDPLSQTLEVSTPSASRCLAPVWPRASVKRNGEFVYVCWFEPPAATYWASRPRLLFLARPYGLLAGEPLA